METKETRPTEEEQGTFVTPPRNSMLAQLGHHQLVQQQQDALPPAPSSFYHPSRGFRNHLTPIVSSSSSQTTLNQTEFDLPFDHSSGHSSQFPSLSHGHRSDIKRPDSVITTSSIVSSSDTASQTGDSSAESTHGGPPSVYAITGLYGPPRRPQRLEDVKDGEPMKALPSTSSAGPPHALLSKTKSSNAAEDASVLRPAFVQNIKTHRRQISYPVTFQPIKNANPGCCLGQATNKVTSETSGGPNKSCTVVRHGSNPINGHKRSHSYGHHRPALHGHRRTGSSVIETLQTLSCTSGGDGHHFCQHHETSLAQFLENLKKEQQEK